MTTQSVNKLLSDMETYIDRNSVSQLLAHIATICREKSDHIIENWQDANTAKPWNSAANAINSATRKVRV